MRYGLIYRGNLIPLGPAPTVIGRSAGCKIVLDDTEISRRHARLLVSGDGLVVEDLGSANGVFVNGEPVDRRRDLAAGDRIVIGAQEFEVTAEADRPKTVKRKRFRTPYGRDEVRRNSVDSLWEDEEVGDEGESTGQTSQLALMSRASDRLLADGRVDEAEKLIEPVLQHALAHATKARRRARPEAEAAARYAIKLAGATGRGRWIDYVFQLASATELSLSTPLVDQLLAAVDGASEVASEPLRAYLDTVRPGAAELDEPARQALDRLRALERKLAAPA